MMKKGKAMVFGILFLFIVGGGQVMSHGADVPGVTNDSILLGGLIPMAGPLSTVGVCVRDGWMMVIDKINEQGGINGRRIKVLWEDDGCNPGKGQAAVKKLVTRDNVFALVAGLCSNAIAPAVEFIEQSKIPYFTGSLSDPNTTMPTKRYIFRAGIMGATYQGCSAAKLAVEYFKGKKVGIVHVADEYGVRYRDAVKAYLERAGIKPTAVEAFNPGDPDYTAQLTNLKNAGSEIVIMVAYPPDGAKIVTQAKKRDFNPMWIGAGATSEPSFAAMAQDAAVGTTHLYTCAMLVNDTHIPKMAEFASEFKKRIGEKQGRPGVSELMNYSAAMVFCEGLKRAGRELTRERLVDALESIKDFETYLPGKVTFSKENHQGNLVSNFVVWLPNGKQALLQYNTIGE
jgi:branched-chain amino acid transport system substrate-binding protein